MGSNVNKRMENLTLEVTDDYVHIEFPSSVEILSSAVLNGGHTYADGILNLRVPKNESDEGGEFLPPEVTIEKYIQEHNWNGEHVGMMTAAKMESFAEYFIEKDDVKIQCFVTLGLSNARRAGDKADWPYFDETVLKPGTINIIFGTNANLTKEAMVECIMMITEAKAAAMQDLIVISPISDKIATGTGTDSVVVFNGQGREIRYCGKHVLFGEMLATAVYNAINASVDKLMKIFFDV